MATKRKPVMDRSVLGTPRVDDSDYLRSGILQAEAEFLVSVSAVEGIPSPWLLLWMLISANPVRICWNVRSALNAVWFCKSKLLNGKDVPAIFACFVSRGLGEGPYHVSKVPNQRCFGMQSIGCGLAAPKRFFQLMNMPQPPRQTPYALHNKELLKEVKVVAVETMTSAAEKIHFLQPAFQDGLVKCGVSCVSTWQRRGYFSLNGCVTAISMDTGKILDVLSKVIVTKCQSLVQFATLWDDISIVTIMNWTQLLLKIFKMWKEDHLWNSAGICAKTLNTSLKRNVFSNSKLNKG